MKYKMNKGEKKTDFATRLINEHGEFLSASEAYELIRWVFDSQYLVGNLFKQT
jgi:hypothetical protein